MRPDERDLDEEIRGHLALAIKERLDRGDSPEAARLAALRDLGYAADVRDSMRRVWSSRWFDALEGLGRDVRVGFRSLCRAKGLAATVVVTLALGIGANAAIFSVVREVLLRPLVNRDADRLVYIRQSAPGLGAENVTFSMAEIADFEARVTTIAGFGDFSSIPFTMIGVGEPRVVRAGVVGGSYFEVMGLRPALGRLLGPADDGPDADPAVVLTHRFWTTALNADPSIVGRIVRLDARAAMVVGVLEPSLPYPADTEVMVNVVTSSHHLGATMVTERTHRMTELFGRLAPGATLEAARAELASVHANLVREHPEAYPGNADMRLSVTPFGEQLTRTARPVLLLLLVAAGLVFVIACANVANLLLARAVRRESELAVRAALGASHGALRRALLGESLVLCGAGAALGMLLAGPLVTVVGRFASRFSVRAHGVTVDATLLWAGAALAMAAAVILAYVPRLPVSQGPAPAQSGVRVTSDTGRRLRAFAVIQVALSFVLLAGAGVLLAALVALQSADTGFDTRRVLALDVPQSLDTPGPVAIDFAGQMVQRIERLPGVERAAVGNVVPWRDANLFGPGFRFAVEGHVPDNADDPPHARLRNVSPGFFSTLGVPFVAGRDFTDADRAGSELVVIVSQSLAERAFPGGHALNRRLWWTDPYFGKPAPRRVVGVVADTDDEQVVPGRAMTIYHPFRQLPYAGRLFVRTAGDPYALVAPIAKIAHALSPGQPVERAATLADVRAEVLAPERLNAFVLAGFGGMALVIAVVGVGGVLAFAVSARTRELGVRLAMGSSPRRLLLEVLSQGVRIVAVGIAAGAVGGYALFRAAAGLVDTLPLPGPVPVVAAAGVLMGAAIAASLLPAARAARVDVLRALGSE
jgi:predicted permease